jgi:hypothetical protein
MAHAQLQPELDESKLEFQRLRMSLGAPTVHKDLSLLSIIPKWSGAESSNSLEEFISTLEASARIGRWDAKDTLEIATLKLEGSARVFYQGCTQLHTREALWDTFKKAFRKRYKDVHTDQFHYARLQMARQGRNEIPQEFADRCRKLAQRITGQSDDPVVQGVHRENAERMLLASYISGLIAQPGKQVRYANPVSMDQAIRIAVSVDKAKRQEKFNNNFYARNEYRTDSDRRDSRHAANTRKASEAVGRRKQIPQSASKTSTRNAQTKAALSCYECEGIGHFVSECQTRLRREQENSQQPGGRNRTERSRRFESTGEKPPNPTRQDSRKESYCSGNDRKV